MNDEVIKFINKRFKKDCNWMNENSFYFASILKSRFPMGTIYYDINKERFLFRYGKTFYNWKGEVQNVGEIMMWKHMKTHNNTGYMNRKFLE